MKRIYLDYAATTPIRKEVRETMKIFEEKIFGNPSSIHKEGRTAKTALEKARNLIAEILEVKSSEIIFTNGGTESINLALFGISRANKKFFKKPRLITSKIEHPAVLNSMKQLEKEGFEIIYINVNKDGLININELKNTINENTILVSIMYANNEIGTIQPIEKISKIIKDYQNKKRKNFPLFHTDACQAAGYLDIRPKKLGVDLLTLNASKIYGPKASGLLYIKENTLIEPLIFGGGQENNLCSGTENVSGWIGLAKALELAQKEKDKESKRLINIRDYAIKNILKIEKTFLNGHPKIRLPNNINIIFLDIEGEALVLKLDKFGISASTGSACHSKTLEPSHVLTAIGLKREAIHGSLRLTLGKETTKKDIDYLLKVLPKIIKELRALSPISLKK
jgi:cysteine desulfurase